jgi:hypothetical protein
MNAQTSPDKSKYLRIKALKDTLIYLKELLSRTYILGERDRIRVEIKRTETALSSAERS